MPQQLLDNGFEEEKVFFPAAVRRWTWYFKHGGLIIGLHLIVLFFVLLVLPYMPKAIEDILSIGLLALLIFGIYGISIYTCVVGFKWNIGAALIGGSLLFFVCFILVMTNLDALKEIYGPQIIDCFGLSEASTQDILDIMLIGVGYSILTVPFAEGLALIGQFFLWIWAWWKGRVK